MDKNFREQQLLGRKTILDIFECGLEAADPQEAIRKNVELKDNLLIISSNEKIILEKETRIFVVGAGKASASMALAMEEILGEYIAKGLICVPKEELERNYQLKKIILQPAGHPYVNEGSISGAKKILEIISDLTEKDVVIALISGGGSALMELPIKPITLLDLENVFDLLTKSGASIHELNTIRKHFSKIKGGKLAQAAQPAKVYSLIISDVVGDNLDTIASGPTAPDNSTWQNVEAIFEKYNLKKEIPKIISEITAKGLSNTIEETPKDTEMFFENVFNFVIGSNAISCEAMKEKGEKMGLECEILSTSITGEAKNFGEEITTKIMNASSNTLLIAGGETTVKIAGSGKGGRNQELVLASGFSFDKTQSAIISSIGSDGKDGPTDAAGAFMDTHIIDTAEMKGLSMKDYLNRNDSYNFFKKTSGLILTGHTGTNVMDFILALKL